ncbi:MAG: DUF885 domain-containing protein [Bryobacterales bacterium]|nr:DUF885 domain-containing protein [Bryobacterales bacterium]
MRHWLLVVSLFTTTLAAGEPFDRFFNEYLFPYSPTTATSDGFHQYDSKLEDYSPASRERQVVLLKQFLAEFRRMPPSADRDLVLSRIQAGLLELETIRMWEKNADIYSSGLTYSVFTIISRTFAPPAERLRSLIGRERQAPAMLAAARENLKNPPRIYTEVAIEQLPGTIHFFENDVPAAFHGVSDAKLMAEFRQVNGRVVAELRSYGDFLKSDLLPRSNGDFRIGAAAFSKKLLYDEMVDLPLDRLLDVGYENLRQNQRAFRETAAKLDSKRTPEQILEGLNSDHPAPSALLATFRHVLTGLRSYIEDRHIVTIPSPVLPVVEETPPFMRALTFASMDTPGPYENIAKEAFFNVTLPSAGWSRERVAEFMGGFNRGTIISTAVHEVYPGHYTQFLWLKKAPTKVRKLLGCSSNAEGWAHYCEQMMLDERYGNGDLRLRLGQLQDALLRNARYIVGIEMHAGKMTYQQGIDFFVKEGFQTRANAERETKRGTSDPTYLVYTLGKLEILKLRADYQRAKGAAFRLGEFHDRFLEQGYPPVRIVRRALLGNDGPML